MTPKSLLAAKFVMLTCTPLLLVTVTVLDELAPTIVLLKLVLGGEKVNGPAAPTPVPESAASTVAKVPPETARLPFSSPFPLGVKLTLTVHFFFAARLPVHGAVPLPMAE